MKKILLFLCFFLVGCVTHPPLVEKGLKFRYDYDCLPQAIIMTEALKEKGVEAKVLSIYTDKWGHSICIYMYPKGKNQMWGWDRMWMSNRIRAWKDDPNGIAKEWMRITLSDATLNYAVFQE